MPTILADLLKDSAYRLDQFQPDAIAALEVAVTLKTSAKTATPYVNCLVHGMPIKLTPEEVVRKLYLRLLHHDLGYPISRMQLEYPATCLRHLSNRLWHKWPCSLLAAKTP